jgi:[CysO sulfur-carrier protein]-S-L-cysteine hydrolase
VAAEAGQRVLSEPRIQRYARQILLRDVGGVGQEALGARGVRLAARGPLLDTAATYLRAGGTAVEPAAIVGPWAADTPLLDRAPDGWLEVVIGASPAVPPCAVVGVSGNTLELWSVGAEGCLTCVRERLGTTSDALPAGPAAVVAGGALAVLVQRRLLGLAPGLEGLSVSAPGVVARLEAPRCAHRPPALPAPVLAEVLAHLRAAWPEEGCGVLLEGEAGLRFLPLANAQATHHARDPEAFPRDARHAFTIEPATWLRLMKESEARGDRLAALVHSHPQGPARFSDEDLRQAAPDGLPLFPGMAHLVVAFQRGTPVRAVWALWRNGGFAELDCPLAD